MTMHKKFTKVIGWLILGLVAFLIIYLISDFLDVDRCLDGGGAWNYRDSICEK